MQNLYMMATLTRENQMKKMVKELNAGLISIEQAMVKYNVATREAVIDRVEKFKQESRREEIKKRAKTFSSNIPDRIKLAFK